MHVRVQLYTYCSVHVRPVHVLYINNYEGTFVLSYVVLSSYFRTFVRRYGSTFVRKYLRKYESTYLYN